MLEIDKIIQKDFIELPAEFNGSTIKWTSSDPGVITDDGKVTQPEKGYKAVVMMAETSEGKQEFEVIVLPEEKIQKDIIYKEDYSSMASDTLIATTWTSKDKQNCLYVEADATHDSFIKFAAGNTSTSQGANTEFGIKGQEVKDYTVGFDVALDAGTRDTTEFAITGTDATYKNGDTNAGIENGYILKLSSDNSTLWQINGTDKTCTLPFSWVHVKAIASAGTSKAAIIISDEENIYFAGEVNINGTGIPGGLYLKWGNVQALVSVDNVEVTKW